MDATAAPDADFDAKLAELAGLGMRAARVVTRMMEIEQAASDIAASWLPEMGTTAASLGDAIAAGQAVDTVTAAMAEAVPRVEVLALALDRVSRSVRRSLALLRRMQAGWPAAASPDDRAAMVRRQVARGVGDMIRREADGEAAERLFDELAERLDDCELERHILDRPVDEIVRRIGRDLGLAAGARRLHSRRGQSSPPPLLDAGATGSAPDTS
jgi:hypothetical protein